MNPRIEAIHPAGPNDQVVTVAGARGNYRKTPCPGCPWVKENVGQFPAAAFRHSARTASDLSTHRFGCHESGTTRPAACAGFLLRGADHNLAVRMDVLQGRIDLKTVHADGRELFNGYKEMALAHGVSPDDDALQQCR